MAAAEDSKARKISDRAVINGVKIEFDRTLPFWRCFVDLHSRYANRPVVMERDTTLRCRLPCSVFSGVDVVWAVTTVTMKVQTGLRQRRPTSSAWWATSASAGSEANDGAVPGHKRSAQSVVDDGVPDKSTVRKQVAEMKKHSRYWRDVPHRTVTYTIGTMHFVHDDAHVRGSDGAARSFHVQSVVLYEERAVLQCVAGTMVVFAFLVYSCNALLNAGHLAQAATTGDSEENKSEVRHGERQLAAAGYGALGLSESVSEATETVDTQTPFSLHQPRSDPHLARAASVLFPSSRSRILILGMGGNSMAFALRQLLGPDAELHIVEVEPAVIKACELAGTLDRADPHTTVHESSAHTALRELSAADPFDMVFMDLFEPLKANMDNASSLVSEAVQTLVPGGLLVVNDHRLPTAAGLASWAARFGPGNVQAVNLHGWKESVIVCVKPGNAANDGLGNETSRWTMGYVHAVYERLVPGWLPPPSWLQKSAKVGGPDARVRVWTS